MKNETNKPTATQVLLRRAGWRSEPAGSSAEDGLIWRGPHGPAWMSERDAFEHLSRDLQAEAEEEAAL